MLIVDAHLDLGMNALRGDRDLQCEVMTIRSQELGLVGSGRGLGTVALPDLRRGRVAVCVATSVSRCTGTPEPGIDFRAPAQAYAAAHGQFAYYRALECLGEVSVLEGAAAFDEHVASWQQWEAAGATGDTPPIGLVLSMESADPVLSPDDLGHWHELGVRLIGPAHYGPGRYAGGTGVEAGLSPSGKQLLTAMEQLGIGLDVTHLSDRAFWEALEQFSGVVIASHNNCRTLVSHQRQLDDAQIRALIERDAVIGTAAMLWMLEEGWVPGHSSNACTDLSRLCDHIDHVCQLAGDARHAGIGSDLDGGISPSDLKTVAELQRLVSLLSDRGYGEEDVASIMHGNWLRILRRVLDA